MEKKQQINSLFNLFNMVTYDINNCGGYVYKSERNSVKINKAK